MIQVWGLQRANRASTARWSSRKALAPTPARVEQEGALHLTLSRPPHPTADLDPQAADDAIRRCGRSRPRAAPMDVVLTAVLPALHLR